MATHKANISWQLSGSNFVKGQFSRAHTWTFDGGTIVPASSSPSVVPPPNSNPAAVDPEEAYVASISSCHMLTFIYLASRQGYEVQSYVDDAVGITTRNEQGKTWVSSVTLHPKIVFSAAKQPTPEELERLHHGAHEQCFIANSVKSTVTVE